MIRRTSPLKLAAIPAALAVAAFSFASGSITSKSSAEFTYTLDAGLYVGDITTADDHDVYINDPSNTADYNFGGSITSSYSGATFQIDVEATTTLSATEDAHVGYRYGRAYLIDVWNPTADYKAVRFDFSYLHSINFEVDDPSQEYAYSGSGTSLGATYLGSVVSPTDTYDTDDANPVSFSTSGSDFFDSYVEPFSRERYVVAATCFNSFTFTPAPVPEPASWAALGLGGAALLRRRRAKRA